MKFNVDKIKVGERIFNIRNSLNLTLEQLGKDKEINAERSNVSKWERGATLPNKSRLQVIAKKGNISLNKLLYGSIDEFLENNIDVLIENSDYPIKLSNNELHITYKQVFCSYIRARLKETPLIQNGINPIENIDTLCNLITSFINEYVQKDMKNIYDILIQHKNTTMEVLKSFPTCIDIQVFNISEEMINILYGYDTLIEYLPKMNNTEVVNNYLLLKHLRTIVIKKAKNNRLNLEERVTLYISLSDIVTHDINLHTENYIGFDFLFKESTFIENKYNIDNYDIIVGLKIEQENSLFYLANYQDITDVPLNTEAKYFILNHDNTYQITKITEIPNCKYIAPIIGKLE